MNGTIQIKNKEYWCRGIQFTLVQLARTKSTISLLSGQKTIVVNNKNDSSLKTYIIQCTENKKSFFRYKHTHLNTSQLQDHLYVNQSE